MLSGAVSPARTLHLAGLRSDVRVGDLHRVDPRGQVGDIEAPVLGRSSTVTGPPISAGLRTVMVAPGNALPAGRLASSGP